MSKYNLGIVKASLLSNLNEQTALKEFVKILKESDTLKIVHSVFDNLEKKHIPNEDLAVKYIDENIKLVKDNCTKEQFDLQTSKFLPLMEGVQFADSEHTKLYEHIHTMLYESLNGSKKPTNVNKLYDSFCYVLEHLKTNNKKRVVEEIELPKDVVIDDFIVKRAIHEFNKKYSGVLSEEEISLIKSIVHDNKESKKKSFLTIKESTLHSLKLLQDDLKNQDQEKLQVHEQRESTLFAEKINESITNIEKLEFVEDSFVKDVLDLVNLKKELE